jgi:hypothetical protein
MKAAKPKHRFGDELEAHLKPLEVAFVGRYVVLTEDTELMFGEAKDHVGVDPRIGVSRVRLPGPVKCFGGDENLEITG